MTEASQFDTYPRLSVAEAINQAIHEEMARDQRCILLGEDVRHDGGLFGATKGLVEAFGPDRVIDTPISEPGFTGMAIGYAMTAGPAIVEYQIFDFVGLAMDQLCNHAAKAHYMSGGQLSVPLVVRGPCALGSGLAAQHSQGLENWFASIPGLKLVAPTSAADAKGLLKAAIRDPNPVVFLEQRVLYGSKEEIPPGDYVVPIGKAKVIRPGSDVSIIASSLGVRAARGAIRSLESGGVDVEVIDLRTIRPIDTDVILESAEKTGRVVIVSSDSAIGGVASVVSQVLWDGFGVSGPRPAVAVVTGSDNPVAFSRELERLSIPNVEQVLQAVDAVMTARSAARTS